MFTGVIEELGQVIELERQGDSGRLTVRGQLVTTDAVHGASIAVNGVCLTVVDHDAETFTADVMAETLARSTLGTLVPGSSVNLERAMLATGRFGGHIVQGHVDSTSTIAAIEPSDRWTVVHVDLPPHLRGFLAEKGSIAIDGVSLTVVAVTDDSFSVALIPTTLDLTTLGQATVGSGVNLEVDVVAKYVSRLLATASDGPTSGIRS